MTHEEAQRILAPLTRIQDRLERIEAMLDALREQEERPRAELVEHVAGVVVERLKARGLDV